MTIPTMIPLFVMASSAATDIGYPLNRSAIVARGYDVPAGMATGAAIRRIRNRQMIIVHRTEGMIIRGWVLPERNITREAQAKCDR
jgi:phosphoenolpyruvate-protein kinase (PTS system EI component)